jgi:hypothetical protein
MTFEIFPEMVIYNRKWQIIGKKEGEQNER